MVERQEVNAQSPAEHKKVARDLINGCLAGAIGIYLTQPFDTVRVSFDQFQLSVDPHASGPCIVPYDSLDIQVDIQCRGHQGLLQRVNVKHIRWGCLLLHTLRRQRVLGTDTGACHLAL